MILFRTLLAVSALLCASVAARAEEEIVVVGHGPQKSPTIKRVDPVIPKPADEVAKEGWVHLVLALSAGGDVTEAKIVEAYPKGWFESSVMRVVYGWKFHPRRENGVAVPDPAYDISVAFYSDEYETGRNPYSPVERGGRVRGVNNANLGILRRVRDALDRNDPARAEPDLIELKRRLDTNNLSVTDTARYIAFRARHNRLAGDYTAALSDASQALMLARFFDNGKVVYGLHLEVLASLAGLGLHDDAVDYYDSWWRMEEVSLPPSVVEYVEALRSAGGGKGRFYNVQSYADVMSRKGRVQDRSPSAGGGGSSMGGGGGGSASVEMGGSGNVIDVTTSGGSSGPTETRSHLQVAVQAICLDLPLYPVGNCSH